MKTSELKKSFTQFAVHGPKPIRLKFQNMKNEEEPEIFTYKDFADADIVYKSLQQAIRQKKALNNQIMEINIGLVKKLKKISEQNEKENIDAHKIRFRIVKSVKKSSISSGNQLKKNQQENENQSFKATIAGLGVSQNRSQLVEMRQNSSHVSQSPTPLSSSLSGSWMGKVKLKKIQSKKSEGAESTTQAKTINNEELIKKLKFQLRNLSNNYEEKCKDNENLDKKIKELEAQKQKFESKVKEMENLEKINLECKFSLKCLELEKPVPIQPENIPNLPNKQMQKKELNDQNQINKAKGQLNQYQKPYYQELCNHLKLMIVSQSKEIQILQKKISQKEKLKINLRKSDKWNQY